MHAFVHKKNFQRHQSNKKKVEKRLARPPVPPGPRRVALHYVWIKGGEKVLFLQLTERR